MRFEKDPNMSWYLRKKVGQKQKKVVKKLGVISLQSDQKENSNKWRSSCKRGSIPREKFGSEQNEAGKESSSGMTAPK